MRVETNRKFLIAKMSVVFIVPALMASTALMSAPVMAKSLTTAQKVGQVSGASYSIRGTYVGTDPDASIRQQFSVILRAHSVTVSNVPSDGPSTR